MATSAATNYFMMPMFNLMGPGCRNEIGTIIAARGLKKALIVTDEGMVDVGLVAELTEVLDRSAPLARWRERGRG